MKVALFSIKFCMDTCTCFLKNPIDFGDDFFFFLLRSLFITGKKTKLPTLVVHYYLLFKNTFHNFLRSAPFIHEFLIVKKIFKIFRFELADKSEKYEKRIVVLTFHADICIHINKWMMPKYSLLSHLLADSSKQLKHSLRSS